MAQKESIDIERYLFTTLSQSIRYNDRVKIPADKVADLFDVEPKTHLISVYLDLMEKNYFDKFIRGKHEEYITSFIKTIEMKFLQIMITYELHNSFVFNMKFYIEGKVYDRSVECTYGIKITGP